MRVRVSVFSNRPTPTHRFNHGHDVPVWSLSFDLTDYDSIGVSNKDSAKATARLKHVAATGASTHCGRSKPGILQTNFSFSLMQR
jgi:hypothetical protein